MSDVFYCKGWFRAKKRALESYTTAQAQALHESGELYCALIGSPTTPICFLEVKRGFVGVGFLDEKLREVLSYSFQEGEPSKLFLSMATHREFESNSDTVLKGTSYIFSLDGKPITRREEFSPSHKLDSAESTTDISDNWEPFPKFGSYSHLARAER